VCTRHQQQSCEERAPHTSALFEVVKLAGTARSQCVFGARGVKLGRKTLLAGTGPSVRRSGGGAAATRPFRGPHSCIAVGYDKFTSYRFPMSRPSCSFPVAGASLSML
jgi:hypothetical protein